MTRFQRWMLKRITEAVVLDREEVIAFYGVLGAAAREAYPEDNQSTREYFLRECHEEVLVRGRQRKESV